MVSPFIFMRFGATLDLGLIGAEYAFHWAWLPLGGGHSQQLMLAFLVSYVVAEIVLMIREIKRSSVNVDDDDPGCGHQLPCRHLVSAAKMRSPRKAHDDFKVGVKPIEDRTIGREKPSNMNIDDATGR